MDLGLVLNRSDKLVEQNCDGPRGKEQEIKSDFWGIGPMQNARQFCELKQ